MAYEWQPRECNAQGIPYSKLANVCLERNGELETFLTQEGVDQAWADGWHEPGRPETADELRTAREHSVSPGPNPPLPAEPVVRKRKGWPKGKPRKSRPIEDD